MSDYDGVKICSADDVPVKSSAERNKKEEDDSYFYLLREVQKTICKPWYDDEISRLSLSRYDSVLSRRAPFHIYHDGWITNRAAAERVALSLRESKWNCKIKTMIVGHTARTYIEVYNPKKKPSWWRTF